MVYFDRHKTRFGFKSCTKSYEKIRGFLRILYFDLIFQLSDVSAKMQLKRCFLKILGLRKKIFEIFFIKRLHFIHDFRNFSNN